MEAFPEVNGLINVLKPPGITSHALVLNLRRLFRMQKIGHTGTLDPGAAGVLPICVGQGTRVAEYLVNKPKSYRAEMTFGITTETHDAGGKVLKRLPGVRLERARVEEVLQDFIGEIKQVPPMTSALHYRGKRLYKLAREGKTVDRRARKVHIYEIKLIRFDGELPYPRLLCDITCSKGTYVRSLCADIGEKLGCGAFLSFLVRTASGPFQLSGSYTLEEIKDRYERQDFSFLLPIDYALEEFPALIVKEKAVPHVLNGQPLAPAGIMGGAGKSDRPLVVRLYAPDGSLLALGNYRCSKNGEWYYKPQKVFCLLHQNI
jgi:tRNA pseudouridine55 synthase